MNLYKNGQLQITGKRASEKLYYLDLAVKIQDNCLTATSRPLSLSVWHERLGHANYWNIIKMSKLNVIDGLQLADKDQPQASCRGCILGIKIYM